MTLADPEEERQSVHKVRLTPANGGRITPGRGRKALAIIVKIAKACGGSLVVALWGDLRRFAEGHVKEKEAKASSAEADAKSRQLDNIDKGLDLLEKAGRLEKRGHAPSGSRDRLADLLTKLAMEHGGKLEITRAKPVDATVIDAPLGSGGTERKSVAQTLEGLRKALKDVPPSDSTNEKTPEPNDPLPPDDDFGAGIDRDEEA